MSTVREIAEYAGVSKSTVSLVLNNKSGVSDEMRQTVLNAVDELNSLRTGTPVLERTIIERGSDMKVQAHTIMVLHPPVLRSSYVFGQVLQGIQSVAEMNKLQLRLVVNDPKASSQHVSHLYLTDDYLRPDGALMFGAQKHELLLDKVVEQGIPCVVLGREVKRYDVSGIERDETRYAYQLTQHLIELGHRSIVFAGGDQRYDFTHTRLLGYQLAMEDAGAPPKPEHICLGDGATATQTLLDANPDTTAIIYVNDSYAQEGVSVLSERGLAIPDNIAIASFDNSEFAQTYDVPITSIAYDHYKEGQWAIKMLLEKIRYPFIDKSHLSFKGNLIVRASTDASQLS